MVTWRDIIIRIDPEHQGSRHGEPWVPMLFGRTHDDEILFILRDLNTE